MAYAIQNHSKLWNKAKAHAVEFMGDTMFHVTSSTSSRMYEVDIAAYYEEHDGGHYPIAVCTCERQQYIGQLLNGGVNRCSHVMAAENMWAEMQTGKSLTPRDADDVAAFQRLKRKAANYASGDNVRYSLRSTVYAREIRKTVVGLGIYPSSALDELNELLFGTTA